MLDIKLIRENPEVVRKNLQKRGDAASIRMLGELIEEDKKWRSKLQELEKLRHERNKATERVAELKRQGKSAESEIRKIKEIPGKIKTLETETVNSGEKVVSLLMRLPNLLHDSVPIGKDETENQLVRKWGKMPKFAFQPKDHIDICVPNGWIDIEHAAKTSGSRFYFLKGDVARLDMALMHYGWDFMVEQGFTPVWPPFMMKRKPYEGVVDISDFGNVMYKVEGEDLYMIATSEHPLTAQHMDEVVDASRLPLLYSGFSTNFRKEAGTHGKDTKGIFRVHQFNKVEQIVLCRPEDSWKWHEKLIQNAEKFFQSLGLSCRVINICTGDIGTVAAKKYDLDVWLPGQNNYREAVSCSNCTDYQARRLGIKYREGEGLAPAGHVHTLNSTLVTDRGVIAIIENFQQKDGSVLIPKVLWPYMGGLKKIGANKR